jgi:hypothetical protein
MQTITKIEDVLREGNCIWNRDIVDKMKNADARTLIADANQYSRDKKFTPPHQADSHPTFSCTPT